MYILYTKYGIIFTINIKEVIMHEFISESKNNKNILQSALLSINLPVNILIIGSSGLGKKLLAKQISPNTDTFDALTLEELINNSKIDISLYEKLILHNVDKLLNKQEFFKTCEHIKLIATSNATLNISDSNFAVKLQLNKLEENPEDLEIIKQSYIKEAMFLSSNNKINENIKYDLSQNGKSLKKSIFKSIFNESIGTNELEASLEKHIFKELTLNKTYKELLEVFEIPLLKASQKSFKSQVKMAKALDINRITLRKKLHKYFGV